MKSNPMDASTWLTYHQFIQKMDQLMLGLLRKEDAFTYPEICSTLERLEQEARNLVGPEQLIGLTQLACSVIGRKLLAATIKRVDLNQCEALLLQHNKLTGNDDDVTIGATKLFYDYCVSLSEQKRGEAVVKGVVSALKERSSHAMKMAVLLDEHLSDHHSKETGCE